MSEKKYLPEHIDTYEDLIYTFDVFRVDSEKTRFFVDQDYDGPKAYVIKRNGIGEFEVYKRKADGSKAVRYQGSDEAYAVNEFYQKFLEEVRKRPEFAKKLLGEYSRSNTRGTDQVDKLKRSFYTAIAYAAIMLSLLGGVSYIKNTYNKFVHRKDGYYQTVDNTYYRLGRKMYYYDRLLDDWYFYGYFSDFDDYYDDWEYYDYYDDHAEYDNFEKTQYYEDWEEEDSDSGWSDSDSWDSWDSDFSDWDSDW